MFSLASSRADIHRCTAAVSSLWLYPFTLRRQWCTQRLSSSLHHFLGLVGPEQLFGLAFEAQLVKTAVSDDHGKKCHSATLRPADHTVGTPVISQCVRGGMCDRREPACISLVFREHLLCKCSCIGDLHESSVTKTSKFGSQPCDNNPSNDELRALVCMHRRASGLEMLSVVLLRSRCDEASWDGCCH